VIRVHQRAGRNTWVSTPLWLAAIIYLFVGAAIVAVAVAVAAIVVAVALVCLLAARSRLRLGGRAVVASPGSKPLGQRRLVCQDWGPGEQGRSCSSESAIRTFASWRW
jgi:hypothetical protein